MNGQRKTVRRESNEKLVEVTFTVYPRPASQSERSTRDVTKLVLEKRTVLLSPLNAQRFRNNPIQETFYGYWYHNAKEKQTFNDFLSKLWDERSQRLSLPRPRKRYARGDEGH